jgi:hypothetical protein
MDQWGTVDVHNIDYNAVIEVDVIMKSKFEPSRRFSVLLAVDAVSSKVFESFLVKIVPCSV